MVSNETVQNGGSQFDYHVGLDILPNIEKTLRSCYVYFGENRHTSGRIDMGGGVVRHVIRCMVLFMGNHFPFI